MDGWRSKQFAKGGGGQTVINLNLADISTPHQGGVTSEQTASMVVAVPGEKCCLIVIDGWGIRPDAEAAEGGDAIRNAQTPHMTQLSKNFASTELEAHGRAVGLPTDMMGNSEVGHLNIGAGRVVFQDIVRIDLAIETGAMEQTRALRAALDHALKGSGRLHFVGLLSDGGVHSHINHLKMLLQYSQRAAIPECYIHAITDGRDTAPTSAPRYLNDLLAFLSTRGMEDTTRLATVLGRYYAMDRDQRWERTALALDALIGGEEGEHVMEGDPSALLRLIEQRAQAGERDEFLKPIITAPAGRIRSGDAIVFFNFRSDRMRQLVSSLGLPADQRSFVPKTALPTGLHITCMTRYRADFPFPVISPPQTLDNVLAEWLAQQGVRQFHTAETEKYAHVTFFFNGGREVQFEGEDRKLVPSPKVATYDLQPTMSVDGVASSVIEALEAQSPDGQSCYPFVMCNLAPPDMVGHTGKYEATIRAVEATDVAIGRIWEACQRTGHTLLITADHGNAEKMRASDGSEYTAHTCSPVPFIIASPSGGRVHCLRAPSGRRSALCDVAPTILALMGLSPPPEMTGECLVAK